MMPVRHPSISPYAGVDSSMLRVEATAGAASGHGAREVVGVEPGLSRVVHVWMGIYVSASNK